MQSGNIFCVGRNYVKHIEELGNERPSAPLLFLKPSHALVHTEGQEIVLPSGRGDIHHELEIVLQIGREVHKGDDINDVVESLALGVDLTLRDIQAALKEKGHPWLRAKGFKNSAIVTPFWSFPGTEAIAESIFRLHKNGHLVQEGTIEKMIFPFQTIIDECAEWFGLKEGDLIFTGTPQGVGALSEGDQLELFWDDSKKGECTIRLES